MSLVNYEVTDVTEISRIFGDIDRQVLVEAKKRGLGLMSKPDPDATFSGSLPKKITVVASEELGDLFNESTQWADYFSQESSLAKANAKRFEAEFKAVKSALRKFYAGESDKDDLIETDRRYLEKQRDLLFYNAYCDFIEKAMDICSRNGRVLSREITRRGQEVERHQQVNAQRRKGSRFSDGSRP